MIGSSAFWLSLYISASYVAAIYTTTKGQEDYPGGRDDPRIIKGRMWRISLVITLNLFLIPWVICWSSSDKTFSFKDGFLALGLVPGYYRDGRWDILSYSRDICKGVSLIALLYVGPLVDLFLYYLFVPDKHMIEDLKDELFTIWGARNYVFAPITEEIIYTSMLINTYLLLYQNEALTYKLLVWKTPLFFGVAHLHHAYEMHNEGFADIGTILFNTIIQTVYTTLFGSLTNYAFLRTGGNLWVCVAIHAICNFMGFPESSKLTLHYTIVQKSESFYVVKLLNLWAKCYMVLLFMGLLFFKNKYSTLLYSPDHQISI